MILPTNVCGASFRGYVPHSPQREYALTRVGVGHFGEKPYLCSILKYCTNMKVLMINAYTVLTSPSDGVVGSLPYRVGDYVGPSIQDGLTTVADNSQMYVYFSLTERDVTERMQECGSMDKMIESFPVLRLQTAGGMDYPVEGRLESVSGVVDRSTGALSARAVFPNPDGMLLSGSTGKLVVSNTLKNAIVIPQAATYEIQDKVYVYKVVDGKAQSVIITVMSISDGQNYVVTGGLTEGETIVAKGASYIKEGMEI